MALSLSVSTAHTLHKDYRVLPLQGIMNGGTLQQASPHRVEQGGGEPSADCIRRPCSQAWMMLHLGMEDQDAAIRQLISMSLQH